MEITLSGPNLRLADLRWLVGQCSHLPGSAHIDVHGRRGRAPEPVDYETIIVHVPDPPGMPPFTAE